MSAKEYADKEKPAYPWTARQRRRAKNGRKSRKMDRVRARNLRR